MLHIFPQPLTNPPPREKSPNKKMEIRAMFHLDSNYTVFLLYPPPQILLKILIIYQGQRNFRLQINFQLLISTTVVIANFPI